MAAVARGFSRYLARLCNAEPSLFVLEVGGWSARGTHCACLPCRHVSTPSFPAPAGAACPAPHTGAPPAEPPAQRQEQAAVCSIPDALPSDPAGWGQQPAHS